MDMLIGVDYTELQASYEDRIGGPGEPVAKLTALGWTCIGPLEPELDDAMHPKILHLDGDTWIGGMRKPPTVVAGTLPKNPDTEPPEEHTAIWRRALRRCVRDEDIVQLEGGDIW